MVLLQMVHQLRAGYMFILPKWANLLKGHHVPLYMVRPQREGYIFQPTEGGLYAAGPGYGESAQISTHL